MSVYVVRAFVQLRELPAHAPARTQASAYRIYRRSRARIIGLVSAETPDRAREF
jgi:hypothetical protein